MAEQNNSDIRASDADRDAVAEWLRIAQAEGRLSLAEYDERVQAAYAAVTHADLKPLMADLPTESPADTDQRAVEQCSDTSSQWRHYSRIAFILVGIWAVTSVASGEPLFFWPIFPLGIWGVIILSHSLFGGGKRR